MSLRVVEHYVSTQGEGPRVGILTQFIRFAGCNMRCSGWPCDTPHAIFPDIWRYESKMFTPNELFHDCLAIRKATEARNICLTGGEPFLQRWTDLEDLCKSLQDNSFTLEVFTNGSFVFPDWVITNFQVNMDWKLPGSGEADTRVEQRIHNAKRLKTTDMVKFVCKHEQDFRDAIQMAQELRRATCEAEFWVGTAFGELSEALLVDLMKTSPVPFRLNVQVHKYIWPPAERGV